MPELLECRPILRSRDIEETRAFLDERSTLLDLPGGARERAGFDARYNGVYLPSLWFGYLRYGTEVALRVLPARRDYWVHFPIDGCMETVTERGMSEYEPRRAAVTSPVEIYTLRTGSRTSRLSICLPGDALTRHLAALLDDAPCAPLEFADSIELDEGFGLGFSRLLYAVARDFSSSGLLASPLIANDFEQLVMTSLLVSQPHNYSAALRARQVKIAPRDVRRALEYIHEHAAEPIGLGDLVRASGVAGRTLLKHFRDFHGASPMRFVRDHRLQRARDELLGAQPGSVSEIAVRWGFTHLGRFAAEYRRRFGESPSSTRMRARRERSS
ncbi:MAG: AraC family transcriptional regulator [Betaproteobacteria bacterium]